MLSGNAWGPADWLVVTLVLGILWMLVSLVATERSWADPGPSGAEAESRLILETRLALAEAEVAECTEKLRAMSRTHPSVRNTKY